MDAGVQLPDPAQLAAALARGERAALARALNLLDDRRGPARRAAAALLDSLQEILPGEARPGEARPGEARPGEARPGVARPDSAHLIGITGPPGAGKSSLTAALIALWRRRGLRVGVLAVDPSSPVSGGALLGDRLRMKTAMDDDGVFIRSLACRGEFGGLSAEVWPMSLVMLAAFDVALIETVGVGQREIDIAAMCDTTCFVAQPGSGDSIQFLKAGILEVPHILVVNKEDMGVVAQRTLSELAGALKRAPGEGGWAVPVLAASATRGTGVESLAEALERHHALLVAQGDIAARRRHYQARWILKRLQEEFGSFGIARLGGEPALLRRLPDSPGSMFTQHDRLRQRLFDLCNGNHD
jgi:LAO/AO transport system kinase